MKKKIILDLDKINTQLEDLFQKIQQAVLISKNSNEEKLKNEVLSVYRDFFSINGINFGEHIDFEKSKIGTVRLKGRTDALYGTLIMEFKKYNLLKNEKEIKKAINQVEEKYLNKLPQQIKKEFAGVIFDGATIIFINYLDSAWKYKISKFNIHSIHDWLILFAGLVKKAFSSELLRNDFSIESEISKKFISKLYTSLNDNFLNPRIQMLFNEWDKTFRYIYGGVLNENKLISDFNDIAKEILRIDDKIYVERFLFVIYTYYSFIIKLIASEISAVILKIPFDSPSKFLMNHPSIKEELGLIENGWFYRDILGVDNYIEGGFFSWYLECLDQDLIKIINSLLKKINEYNPNTLSLSSTDSKDLLRNLYQDIIPKGIRHDLGEFYTPDWLTQLTTEQSGYAGNIEMKVLDPGCGSGSFLIEFINKIKKNNTNIDKKILLNKIVNNIIGFDVNPVAVLTARTNYLLSISSLLDENTENITIPVFLADSILTPTTEGRGILDENEYKISTVEGVFKIHKEIVDKNRLSASLRIIEESIENNADTKEFSKIFTNNIKNISIESQKSFILFYEKIYTLNSQNRNKIWVKIIQNSFAPLLFKNFDYIIGNPPWIKWEFLSSDYKNKLSNLYLKIYNLYSYKGMQAGMGFAHDDISIVFSYVCMDKYLKENGILAFVLKQTLYKSIAGREFRKFIIDKKETRIPVSIKKVIDLLDLKPFKHSGAETSIAIIKKSEKTVYPVNYSVWKIKKGNRIIESMSLSQIKDSVAISNFEARPDPHSKDLTDVWVMNKEGEKIKKAIFGQNHYEVRHGVVNDLNNVFLIKIIGNKNKNVIITNQQKGKKKIANTQAVIEKDLIYPLLKPRHIKMWEIKGYDYIIIPHKKHGVNNESEIKIKYPKTYSYLLKFKNNLLERASKWFKGEGKPFYTLFGIGEYTFKPYKVVWSSIGYLHAFAVADTIDDPIIGKKSPIPDNTISYLSFNDITEAHYVCGILNSNLIKEVFSRRSTKSKWGISIGMVRNLPIPKFDVTNKIHKEISKLSLIAHNNKAKKQSVTEIEQKIEKLVEKIFQ